MGELRGLMVMANRMNLAGGVVAALVLLAASLVIDQLSYGLIAAAALTVPSAVTLLRRQQLAGTGQAAFALLLDQGLASVALLIAVLVADLTLTWMLGIYGAALIAGNIVATLLVRRRLPAGTDTATPRYRTREWLRVSVSLLQSRSARLVLSRLDVLLLPTLASLAAAGIYGAAFRATYILTFPQFVLQTINGPQFAEAFAAGRIDRARRILKLSLAFALLTSLPPLAVFLAAPEWAMTILFGAKFAPGAWALVLVAIGQFAMGLSIPFNAILVMAGSERQISRLNFAVLAGSVAASFWLIPRFGATGAGIVTAVSGCALLATQVWLCRSPMSSGGGAQADAPAP
jgi:O-antigen/teichoic acid export membrane protein